MRPARSAASAWPSSAVDHRERADQHFLGDEAEDQRDGELRRRCRAARAPAGTARRACPANVSAPPGAAPAGRLVSSQIRITPPTMNASRGAGSGAPRARRAARSAAAVGRRYGGSSSTNGSSLRKRPLNTTAVTSAAAKLITYSEKITHGAAAGAKMRRGQEQEHLQPGRAQRHRDDHHREQAQAARAHDPRPHHRRHVAAEAHQHHHEAAAVEPELRHQRVGEERRARQVPRVLDHGHEQEEQDDQRHERRDRRRRRAQTPSSRKPRTSSGSRASAGTSARAAEPVEARLPARPAAACPA